MSEGTKQQIREFIERAIKKSQNPDIRERLKRIREKKKETVAKQYGL